MDRDRGLHCSAGVNRSTTRPVVRFFTRRCGSGESTRRLNREEAGRLQTGVTGVSREEAKTIAEPESPRPQRRLDRLRNELPIRELPVV